MQTPMKVCGTKALAQDLKAEGLANEPDNPMTGVYYRLVIVAVALTVFVIVYISLLIAKRTNWCQSKDSDKNSDSEVEDDDHHHPQLVERKKVETASA